MPQNEQQQSIGSFAFPVNPLLMLQMLFQPQSLASKLARLGLALLLLALLTISATLWLTSRLDGGAAAVNEAGRARMRSYRMALYAEQAGQSAALHGQMADFDNSLHALRQGNTTRPLAIPWNNEIRQKFTEVDQRWDSLRSKWLKNTPNYAISDVDQLVAAIDQLVDAMEKQLDGWTTSLHRIQMIMLMLGLTSAMIAVYAGYRLILRPISQLSQGLKRLEEGDLRTRIQIKSTDEFAALARGFNRMAGSLQASYNDLESQVRHKTAGLRQQRERLEALYQVSTQAAAATTLEELAQGFAKKIRATSGADATAIRWSGQDNQRYLLLASDGLPPAMREHEQCLPTGSCHCGQPQANAHTHVIPIRAAERGPLDPCVHAGFRTLISVPIVLQKKILGEIDLLFRAERDLDPEERSQLDAFATHLATAMEGLQAAALQKEAAIAHERGLLAQELHDSIAQSLIFMNIQLQLLRDARRRKDEAAVDSIMTELDTGVRESYNDVRELLMHFRTRTNTEEINEALRTTLRKFEHQTGLTTHLSSEGHGLPLPADVQVQVLHVVQEALSNVRKHARATQVWLTVKQTPQWSFELRDNGVGMDNPKILHDETHVGMHIMNERAQRIGAAIQFEAAPGQGTCMRLTLPLLPMQDARHAAIPDSRHAKT